MAALLRGGDQISPTLSVAAVVPGCFPLLGTFAAWISMSALGNQDIFYGRVFLPGGTYDRMEVNITRGAGPGITLDMGVYGESGSPPDPANPLLASTGPIDTAGANDTLFTQALTAPITISDQGEHRWLAAVASDAALEIATTESEFNLAWRDRLFRISSGAPSATLGAVQPFDAPADSAIPYLALLRQ